MRKRSKRFRTPLLVGLVILNVLVACRFAWIGWGAYAYREAERLLAIGEFEPARAKLRTALRVWPTDPQVLLLQAQLARRSGAFEEAKTILESPDLSKAAPELVGLEQGLMDIQLGSSVAVSQFLTICEDNPPPPQTPLILEALIEGALKRIDLATARQSLTLWKKHCVSEQQRFQGLIWAGELAIRTGDVETAIDRFREAVDMQPENEAAQFRLAEFLVRYDPQESLDILSRLQQRSAKNDRVTLEMARCYRALGKTDQAIELLDQRIAQNAKDYDALLERGQIALQTQDFTEAERILRSAHALHPERRDSNHYLARALQLAGKTEEYEKFNRVVKEMDATLEERVRQLRESGRLDNATP